MKKLLDIALKKPGHRQLKVSEEIRQILSSILCRGDFFTPELRDLSITITRVMISPDLRNAMVIFMPLGGVNQEEILQSLKKYSNEIRYLLAKEIKLRYVPQLRFNLDDSIAEVEKIEKLFTKISSSKKEVVTE